jgi:hypothetical protein
VPDRVRSGVGLSMGSQRMTAKLGTAATFVRGTATATVVGGGPRTSMDGLALTRNE